jgi:polyisoprenoid-binding protein YceI
MGEHKITSNEIRGKVVFEKNRSIIQEGEFTLSVTSLRHDKAELVCHLQETLSLDYDKSDFPSEHVCEDDRLPTVGKNAPVFLNIVATIKGPLKLGSETVPVSWTIHGVTKELPIKIFSEWDAEKSQLNIRGETKFKRSDFNITVKKFLFIGVDETIPMSFEIVLGDTN